MGARPVSVLVSGAMAGTTQIATPVGVLLRRAPKHSTNRCGQVADNSKLPLSKVRVDGDSTAMGANERMADMKQRRMRVCARLMVALVCVVNATHSLAQQPTTGQVSGHVVDVAGATIKGASVFVRRNIPPAEDVRLFTRTDIHGDFMLVLPEGGYDVLVTSPGFAAGVETVSVLVGRTKKVQWKLKPLNCNFPGMNCDTFR